MSPASHRRCMGFAAALMLLSAVVAAHAADAVPPTKWVATWTQAMTANTAPTPKGASMQTAEPPAAAADFTLRQRVQVSAGGSLVRIRLSNYFGTQPLVVSAAHIALGATNAQDPSRIVAGSDRALTFGGSAQRTIPPGGLATSDAVKLAVPAAAEVVVSLYFASATQLGDVHPMEHAATTTMVRGNAVAAASLADRPRLPAAGDDAEPHIYALSGVDVMVPAATRGVVAFGDSITDGAYATAPDRTWPGVLASLAQAAGAATPMAVVNQGISADELTTDQIGWPVTGMSGLKRYQRDVIDQPGVTDVLVLLGSNDINRGIDRNGQPTGAMAGDLVASLRMLIDVAHQHGLRIYIGTIPPFAGFTEAGWFTPEKEAVREAVNHWIERASGADGVLPFAAALAGDYRPAPLAAAQKPLPPGMANGCAGDTGLHPNDRGYRVMGGVAFAVLTGKPQPAEPRCH